MKKLKENKYFNIGLTTFLIIAACIIFFFLIFKLNLIIDSILWIIKLFIPFIIGFVFAYLLNPIVDFFQNKLFLNSIKKIKLKDDKKLKISRYSSIFLTFIIVIIILVLSFDFIIPELLKSLEILIVNIPIYLEQIKNYLLGLIDNHKDLENIILNNYDAISTSLVNTINNNFLPKIEEWVVLFSNGLFGLIKVLYNTVLGFIISIYFLLDKENFQAQLKKVLYALFSVKKANSIIDSVRYTDKIFGGFIMSKLTICLILALVTFIFLTIFNFPYAIIIALLVGITNIIPYFGPFIGGIPSALIILLQDPSKFWLLIIYLVAIQQIEGYYLEPKIMGMKTGIKSFWVLFAIIIFGGAFGLVGMIIGVPIFAIIYAYMGKKLNKILNKKKLPVETEKYVNIDKLNYKKR
ncbi:MAG: AI-2E family transporter [Bacilli bacterium]|nr:AI-2E family transporter [Bacilli bacterium]